MARGGEVRGVGLKEISFSFTGLETLLLLFLNLSIQVPFEDSLETTLMEQCVGHNAAPDRQALSDRIQSRHWTAFAGFKPQASISGA